MRRLLAAGLLPERAGQPVKAWVHISLADLLLLDGDSALQEQWTAQVRARWAARRAFASETGSEGGAWLDGDAAEAVACDAAMAPDRHRRRQRRRTGGPGPAVRGTGRAAAGRHAGRGLGGAGAGRHRQGRGPAVRPRRAGVLPAPPAARRAAGRAEPAAGHRLLRDDPGRDPQRGDPAGPHCRWAGGCNQPASACDVHHTKHKNNGGKTSTKDCVLLCFFPPPDRHPPVGLDPGPQPGRDDDCVEQGQDESPAQPRTARPAAPGNGPGRVTG